MVRSLLTDNAGKQQAPTSHGAPMHRQRAAVLLHALGSSMNQSPTQSSGRGSRSDRLAGRAQRLGEEHVHMLQQC
jgi:hypothetical protein